MKTALMIAAITASILIATAFGLVLFNQMTTKPQTTPTPLITTTPTVYPTSTPTPTAEPTPEPSIYIASPTTPEYTVEIINTSYTTPPTTYFNPYKNTTTTYPGVYIENYTLVITITNQPFTSVTLPDGNTTRLCYTVRSKGHYEDWQSDTTGLFYTDRVYQFDSGYTLITYSLTDDYTHHLEANSTVDFQVKAQIGYFYPDLSGMNRGYFGATYMLFQCLGESDWSSTQTITTPNV